jgi:hypothetical protein
MRYIPVAHPAGGFAFPNRSRRFGRPRVLITRIPKQIKIKKDHKGPFLLLIWRRARDSNPRTVARQRFSRPPLSTTQPALQKNSNFLFTIPLVNLKGRRNRRSTQGILPFALRASLRLFQIAPGDLVDHKSALQKNRIVCPPIYPSGSLGTRRNRRSTAGVLPFALRASSLCSLFQFVDSYHPDTHPSGTLCVSHFAAGEMVQTNRSTTHRFTLVKRDALQCARRESIADANHQMPKHLGQL